MKAVLSGVVGVSLLNIDTWIIGSGWIAAIGALLLACSVFLLGKTNE